MEPKLPYTLVPTPCQINPVHAPHPTFWRITLILSSYLHLGLPSGLLPSASPPKSCTPFPSPRTCYMPHRLIWSPNNNNNNNNSSSSNSSNSNNNNNNTRSENSMFCSLLHSSVTLFLSGPNIFLSMLFLNTLRLHSSLDVSNQVSPPIQNKRQNYSSV